MIDHLETALASLDSSLKAYGILVDWFNRRTIGQITTMSQFEEMSGLCNLIYDSIGQTVRELSQAVDEQFKTERRSQND